ALSLVFSSLGVDTWVRVLWFLIAAIMPIIQYAWTFFYLRLAEIDPDSRVIEVGPMYAGPQTPGETIPQTAVGGAPHLAAGAPPPHPPRPRSRRPRSRELKDGWPDQASGGDELQPAPSLPSKGHCANLEHAANP